jgi:hypothetical protein
VFIVAFLVIGGIAGHAAPAMSSAQYVGGISVALAGIPTLLLATLIGVPLVLYLRPHSRSVFTRVLIACGALAGGALAAVAWHTFLGEWSWLVISIGVLAGVVGALVFARMSWSAYSRG